MIDPWTYDRYSAPLVEQMHRLEGLVLAFLEALRKVEETQMQLAASGIVNDARRIASQLAGNPGDAALEVYRDLDRDLASTETFLRVYRPSQQRSLEPLLAAAGELHSSLRRLKDLVVETPPDVMAEILDRIRDRRSKSSAKSRSSDTIIYFVSLLFVVVAAFDHGPSPTRMVYLGMYTVSSTVLLVWWIRFERRWAFNLLIALAIFTGLAIQRMAH